MKRKKRMIKQRCIIKDCSENNDNFLKLYGIFHTTLKPDMNFREFKLYYYSGKLEYIDVSFFYDGEKVIGFCAAAFYKDEMRTIGRAAIGILDAYQENGLDKWCLYSKYITYKIKHPLHPLVLTAYVANPLVYAMISKYTAFTNPKRTTKSPEKILKLKEEILKKSGMKNKEIAPFVVKIHFHVHMGEALLKRIYTSKSRNVKHYLTVNPEFQEGYGVLVIIIVSWLNIVCTCTQFLLFAFVQSQSKKYFEKRRMTKAINEKKSETKPETKPEININLERKSQNGHFRKRRKQKAGMH